MSRTSSAGPTGAPFTASSASWWGDRGVRTKTLAAVGITAAVAVAVGVEGIVALGVSADGTQRMHDENIVGL